MTLFDYFSWCLPGQDYFIMVPAETEIMEEGVKTALCSMHTTNR